jgi:hypothetical protein
MLLLDCTSLALAGLLCLGVVPAAIGCGFEPPQEVQLESRYPGSLSVAVALRSAAGSGLIDASTLEAPSTRAALFTDSVHRLHAVRFSHSSKEETL